MNLSPTSTSRSHEHRKLSEQATAPTISSSNSAIHIAPSSSGEDVKVLVTTGAPPNILYRLPTELITQILYRLDPLSRVAAFQTSKHLRTLSKISSIEVDPLQRKIVTGATACAEELLRLNAPRAIGAIGWLIGSIPFALRERFITKVIDIRSNDDFYWVMAGVVPGLHHFREDQTDRLITMVTDFQNSIWKAHGVGFFGRAIVHLRESQRGRLIDLAWSYEDEANKAIAISGLANGIEHLNPVQKGKLVEAATGVGYEAYRSKVIQQLAPELPHLNDVEKKQILDSAISIKDMHLRAAAIGALLIQYENLLTPQQLLINEAVSNLLITDSAKEFITYSDAGLRHLSEEQLSLLISTVARFTYGKEEAFYRLGSCMGHLTQTDRDRIFQLVMRIASEDSRAVALGGLMRGMVHLSPTQRDGIFQSAIHFTNEVNRANAISHLGQHILHLDETQRVTLVTTALEISEKKAGAIAIASLNRCLMHLRQPERIALANASIAFDATEGEPESFGAKVIASLAETMNCLSKDLREKIVAAAIDYPSESGRGEAVGAMSVAFNELNESQRSRLVSAAARLPTPFIKALSLSKWISHLEYMRDQH